MTNFSLTPCRKLNFYLLPKIHNGIMPPPCRPILSANGPPTEKITQSTDHFLSPLCLKVKSYVKDSTHFLHNLELGDIPAIFNLVTLDVGSLYEQTSPIIEHSCKDHFGVKLTPFKSQTKQQNITWYMFWFCISQKLFRSYMLELSITQLDSRIPNCKTRNAQPATRNVLLI